MMLCFFFIFQTASLVQADPENQIYTDRMALFKKIETITQVPWYYFAAMDNYERNTLPSTEEEKVISIQFDETEWFGLGNAAKSTEQDIIKQFGGIGKDGNDDNQADSNDPEDILYTMANHILSYGLQEDDIKIAIWEHYKRDLTVQTIMNTAKVFQKFGDIHLTNRAFPWIRIIITATEVHGETAVDLAAYEFMRVQIFSLPMGFRYAQQRMGLLK